MSCIIVPFWFRPTIVDRVVRQMKDETFAALSGARIIRIATAASCQVLAEPIASMLFAYDDLFVVIVFLLANGIR